MSQYIDPEHSVSFVSSFARFRFSCFHRIKLLFASYTPVTCLVMVIWRLWRCFLFLAWDYAVLLMQCRFDISANAWHYTVEYGLARILHRTLDGLSSYVHLIERELYKSDISSKQYKDCLEQFSGWYDHPNIVPRNFLSWIILMVGNQGAPSSLVPRNLLLPCLCSRPETPGKARAVPATAVLLFPRVRMARRGGFGPSGTMASVRPTRRWPRKGLLHVG
jgi:hypothetical protein